MMTHESLHLMSFKKDREKLFSTKLVIAKYEGLIYQLSTNYNMQMIHTLPTMEHVLLSVSTIGLQS